MGLRITLAAFICSGLMFAGVSSLDVNGGVAATEVPRVPVLAELFTSEGCSSCPPADDLLAELLSEQPIIGAEVIALSEHVDYWNRAGWVDPFSSAVFSSRQQAFAKAFGTDRIYTPQLVVNGTWEAIGSDRRGVVRAVRDAASHAAIRVVLEVTGVTADRLHVLVRLTHVPDQWSGKPVVKVAVAEDGLVSKVGGGENAHRTLRHVGVVRTIEEAGVAIPGVAQTFSARLVLDAQWKRSSLRVVGFVEDSRSRKTLGSGQTRLVAATRTPADRAPFVSADHAAFGKPGLAHLGPPFEQRGQRLRARQARQGDSRPTALSLGGWPR